MQIHPSSLRTFNVPLIVQSIPFRLRVGQRFVILGVGCTASLVRAIGSFLLGIHDDGLETYALGSRTQRCGCSAVGAVSRPPLRAYRSRGARSRALLATLAILSCAAPDLVRAADYSCHKEAHQSYEDVGACPLLFLRRVRKVGLVEHALWWVLAPGTVAILEVKKTLDKIG